jgi:transposase
MNSERFEKWFQDQLPPSIRPGDVTVMDNAAYHSRKSELLHTAAWRKEDIKQWLLAKNIPFPDDSLKRERLQTVESVRSEYTSCVVDEMAEQRGVTVCKLPPYHCELNPIELVWNQIKRHVAVHNTQFKASFMNNLIDNAFGAVSNNQCANYCKHVEHVEQEMWKADNLRDDAGPLIVQLSDSSSGSSPIGSYSQDSVDMTGVAHIHLAGRLFIVCT